jgi:hypothetical protein
LISGAWQAHWVYWLGPILGAALGAFVYQWVRVPVEQPPPQHGHSDVEVIASTQPPSGD